MRFALSFFLGAVMLLVGCFPYPTRRTVVPAQEGSLTSAGEPVAGAHVFSTRSEGPSACLAEHVASDTTTAAGTFELPAVRNTELDLFLLGAIIESPVQRWTTCFATATDTVAVPFYGRYVGPLALSCGSSQQPTCEARDLGVEALRRERSQPRQ